MSKTPDRSERRKQRLEVVYRATDELKPDPANARQHSPAQIRTLANSIETFGFNVLVLVDAELDPGYVDTIVRRWQKLSGGSAVHGISGRSFDELARDTEVANAG